MTQQKFAVKLGVKRNTIAMYEMGKTMPSDQAIKSICREFNINEEWLRSGTGEMFKNSPNNALDTLASEYDLSHADYILIEKFVNLKSEQRAAIVDYVQQAAMAMQNEKTESFQETIKDMTAKEVEDEYKKSRSRVVQKERLSASNIIADNGKTNEQKNIV